MANFLNRLLNNNNPQLQVVQFDENGQVDPIATANMELAQQPLTIRDRLLGRELTKDVQTFNPDGSQAEMVTVVNKRPGLLEDIAQGYNENYNNRFSFNNLGQNKGWGTRIGEGLGTVGRLIDSPLGRGLMAYGLNSALGYGRSLQEGLNAAVGRQNAQTADKLYRGQLKQMGYTDDDLAQINGNITSDVYRNLLTNAWRFRNLDQNTYVKMKTLYDRQLQNGIISPEEYKVNVEALNNQYVNSQIQTMQAGNVEESNQTKLLPYKQRALELAPQISLGNLGVAQGNLALNAQRLQHQIEEDANKGTDEGARVIAQLDELKNLYDQLPQNKAGKGSQKAVAAATGAASQFGLRSDEVAAFEGVSNMVTNLVARKLAGEKGVMTDKDFDRAKKMVPSVYDSPQQADAKIKAIKQLYYVNPQGNNANGSTQVGKYTVRVK